MNLQPDTREFLEWVNGMGRRFTLGDVLQTHFAAEYRKHITLLRQAGYNIPKPVLDRKNPGRNFYELRDGEQLRMAI